MDSRLSTTILWLLLGFICLSFSQVQVEVKLANVSCTCMPNHMCKNNSTQITTGNTAENKYYYEGDIDSLAINITFRPKGGKCPSNLVKCCSPAEETTPPSPPISDKICGNRQPQGVGSRTGRNKENEANYGEFPWMVAVLRHRWVIDNTIHKYVGCGGSIIHPQVVLSGPHCAKGNDDFFIRAGEWDRQNEEMFPTQERNVKEVIIHEEFDGNFRNNIALLVLDQPLELTAVVGTLCLPEQDEVMDGRDCLVSGWGMNVNGEYPAIMKRVEQPVIRNNLNMLHKLFLNHESIIYAGGVVGKDVCLGDSGCPLACPSKGDSSVYVQAGIVTFGTGCGSGNPAAYTNVPLFKNWIEKKLNLLNLA